MLLHRLRKILTYFGVDVRRARDPYNLNAYHKFSDEVLGKRPFYNIGAGDFFHPYWKNIDYVSNWYGGVQKNVIHHDLMSLLDLPIKDDSAKIIYSSHTIEHITNAAVKKLFQQAFVKLEIGGVFRVTTGPDAETDYRALINNDEDWFYWDRMYQKRGSYEHIYSAPATSVSLAERWLHHVASQLSKIDLSPSEIKLNESEIYSLISQHGFPRVLDHLCGLCSFQPGRPGNHINWFTHDKVIGFLREAGFSTIYRSGCGQSSSPLLRNSVLFDSTHPPMSIYVEAIK
jgi:predicted SAM-dependent methyltransferase